MKKLLTKLLNIKIRYFDECPYCGVKMDKICMCQIKKKMNNENRESKKPN